MNLTDYRRSHVASGAGQRYDSLFSSGEYENWVWCREKELLKTIIQANLTPGAFRLLDFACGTGRILSFLEPFAGEAVGVDVSVDMLRLARQRVSRATLMRVDITREGALAGDNFDLVTAFRFFLNADEQLRKEALAALRQSLRDGGLLVTNIHGNLWSLRLPSYLFRRWVLRQHMNAVSVRSMKRLLADAGFRTVQVFGVGWCTPRMFRLFGERWVNRVEDLVQRVPMLSRFTTSLIFVCEAR